MKKLLFLVAFIALSLLAPAADVASFAPEDGAIYSVSRGGKLVRVESFSPVSGGTFALSSVYSADVYTNAIDVATLTNTTYTSSRRTTTPTPSRRTPSRTSPSSTIPGSSASRRTSPSRRSRTRGRSTK